MALKGKFTVEVAPDEPRGPKKHVTYDFAIVSSFRGDHQSVNIDVFLCNDINDEMCAGNFQSFAFKPDWKNSDNVIKQCYEHIKTLDLFAGAERA